VRKFYGRSPLEITGRIDVRKRAETVVRSWQAGEDRISCSSKGTYPLPPGSPTTRELSVKHHH
jgi:hypothetical protein